MIYWKFKIKRPSHFNVFSKGTKLKVSDLRVSTLVPLVDAVGNRLSIFGREDYSVVEGTLSQFVAPDSGYLRVPPL